MKYKQILIPILYIVLFGFFSTTKVNAAAYDLSINPPLLRVHIKPGNAITQVYTIVNSDTADQTLVASIVPFSEADDLGNPVLDPKTTAPWLSYFGLANSDIKLNEPFTIQAGATQQLVLSLTIPDTASLGDIYATLMISTYTNSIDQTLQGTALKATIGSNLLITISGDAFPDTVLRIIDFHPTEGSFIKIGEVYFADSITPMKFTALASNEGKFTADTKGVFRVTTGGGKPVFLDGILPLNVIAKSQRTLVNTNGDSFEFAPSLSQIGPHQISLEIKTDNSNATGTIEVFFFPLKLSLGLILTIIIISLIVRISSKGGESRIENS